MHFCYLSNINRLDPSTSPSPRTDTLGCSSGRRLGGRGGNPFIEPERRTCTAESAAEYTKNYPQIRRMEPEISLTSLFRPSFQLRKVASSIAIPTSIMRPAPRWHQRNKHVRLGLRGCKQGWGRGGEFLLDPNGVTGDVLESLAQAQVHRGDVVVTVLGPDRMIARDPDSLPRRINARCPRRPRVQQSFLGGLESGEWVSR